MREDSAGSPERVRADAEAACSKLLTGSGSAERGRETSSETYGLTIGAAIDSAGRSIAVAGTDDIAGDGTGIGPGVPAGTWPPMRGPLWRPRPPRRPRRLRR